MFCRIIFGKKVKIQVNLDTLCIYAFASVRRITETHLSLLFYIILSPPAHHTYLCIILILRVCQASCDIQQQKQTSSLPTALS